MLRKFLSLGLALLISVGLSCVPASAARHNDSSGNELIMPSVLYPQTSIAGASSYRTTDFTASSSNGNYIRFWFKNNTGEKVNVYLYRTDSGRDVLVKSMSVGGDEQNWRTYYKTNASTGTYFVYIEAIQSGGTISGDLSVAQYVNNPD